MDEGTDHRRPQRYRDAVRTRRAELRGLRRLLTGGHRGDLRANLALARLACATATDAAVAELAAAAGEHIEAGRAARERLPGLLTAALDRLAADLHAEWAGELSRGLRRIAAERGAVMPAGWPRLPRPGRPPTVGPPGPRPRHRLATLLAGAPAGVAAWRLAVLPPVVLSVLGVPAAGAPALGGHAPVLLASACAGTVLAVGTAVVARRAAAERTRWRQHVDAALAAARIALHADLGRRTLELERTAPAALDAAVERRRSEVDAELRLLVPPVAVPGDR